MTTLTLSPRFFFRFLRTVLSVELRISNDSRVRLFSVRLVERAESRSPSISDGDFSIPLAVSERDPRVGVVPDSGGHEGINMLPHFHRLVPPCR